MASSRRVPPRRSKASEAATVAVAVVAAVAGDPSLPAPMSSSFAVEAIMTVTARSGRRSVLSPGIQGLHRSTPSVAALPCPTQDAYGNLGSRERGYGAKRTKKSDVEQGMNVGWRRYNIMSKR